MSDFRKWSKWFEGVILRHDAPETVFAVMAWIMVQADNVGTGFAFDGESHITIANEIGSSPDKVEDAIDFLLEHELIAEKERHENVIAMQAVLP